MSGSQHQAAPDHLPAFLPGPDGADPLMLVTGLILLGAVLGVGLLFLRLHMLPEHIAHRGHKLQVEIVAVLGLLSLFTGVHLFWVAGLLLALIDIPDFIGPMRRIAGSTERIAGSAERISGQSPGHSNTPLRQAGPLPESPPEGQAAPPPEPAPVREH